MDTFSKIRSGVSRFLTLSAVLSLLLLGDPSVTWADSPSPGSVLSEDGGGAIAPTGTDEEEVDEWESDVMNVLAVPTGKMLDSLRSLVDHLRARIGAGLEVR